MASSLSTSGYQCISRGIPHETVDNLIAECSRIAEDSACVRNVFVHSEMIRDLASSHTLLKHLPSGVTPVRCILFDKTPENNWPVAWHQDLTIAVKEQKDTPGYSNWSTKDATTHVQPPVSLLQSMVTARIHLDDTPEENGALKVIPGSHLKGRIPSDQIADHTSGSHVTCVCNAGDILLMKPLILHASGRATSPSHRRVIHIEYADRSSLADGLEWFETSSA